MNCHWFWLIIGPTDVIVVAAFIAAAVVVVVKIGICDSVGIFLLNNHYFF